MAHDPSKMGKIFLWLERLGMVVVVLGGLWAAGRYVLDWAIDARLEAALDGTRNPNSALHLQFNKETADALREEQIPSQLDTLHHDVQDVNMRLARIEGRLLISQKSVKAAESRIAAKLAPSQKATRVVVDSIDADKRVIHAWNAEGELKDFAIAPYAKVFDAEATTQKLLSTDHSFSGAVGVLVYEGSGSSAKPIATSLTIVPAH